jgi:hypothetical protein
MASAAELLAELRSTVSVGEDVRSIIHDETAVSVMRVWRCAWWFVPCTLTCVWGCGSLLVCAQEEHKTRLANARLNVSVDSNQHEQNVLLDRMCALLRIAQGVSEQAAREFVEVRTKEAFDAKADKLARLYKTAKGEDLPRAMLEDLIAYVVASGVGRAGLHRHPLVSPCWLLAHHLRCSCVSCGLSSATIDVLVLFYTCTDWCAHCLTRLRRALQDAPSLGSRVLFDAPHPGNCWSDRRAVGACVRRTEHHPARRRTSDAAPRAGAAAGRVVGQLEAGAGRGVEHHVRRIGATKGSALLFFRRVGCDVLCLKRCACGMCVMQWRGAFRTC